VPMSNANSSPPPHLTTSVIQHPRKVVGALNLQKVPYVELFNGKAQGVVSSGSDPSRVYVSWIEGGTGDFNCSTNNNRPCSGLRGSGCGHIDDMITQAIKHYGGKEVARYLGVTEEVSDGCRAYDITRHLRGTHRKGQGGEVFARFLSYLRYTELEAGNEPLPEMALFITG
jgi:hypothetical protein